MRFTKAFFKSRINWAGILVMLMAVYDYVSSNATTIWNFKTITLFILGLAIVILRTWTIQKPIRRIL